MDRLLKNRLIALCKIGLAAGIVIFIVYKKVDLHELAGRLRDVNVGSILVCWIIYGLLWFVSAWRWRILVSVQGIVVHYFNALRYCFIGLFFNNVMLGSIGGDVLKAYYLARGSPGKTESAFISVIADRTVGSLTFFGLGFVGIALNIRNPRLHGASWLMFALFCATCCALALLYRKNTLKKIPFAQKILDRFPIGENVRRLYQALYTYRTCPSALFKAMLVSSALQLFTIAIFYWIAKELGMAALAYRHLLLLVPLIGTVCALPITPSGWGTGEIAYCSLFGALGIPADQALALDLVIRAMMISWSILGGVLYAFPNWRVGVPDEAGIDRAEKQC
ncbi:MAG: lysylphosphatidylglycerol synthase transmembrane domain-containing protein [bacterium]